MPPDLPLRLAPLLHARDAQLVVDTSGPALRRINDDPAGIDILRLDDREAADLAGRPLADLPATAGFAADLVAHGVAKAVILARGGEGNVLATLDGIWLAACPPQKVASAVGAGDSFVGGLMLALARGLPLVEALRHGSAAAAAAVLTEATDLCRAEDFTRLLPLCRLEQLSITV